MVSRPHLVYVWADRYPDGFPTTVEQFMVDAERLKAEGNFAMTMFFNTGYDGGGATRGIWAVIDSFGGTYSDDAGNMLLDTPENVAAIEFLRDITIKGYMPEITFAGSWQEEEAFKDSSAGAFPTGLFGYKYVNPLVAPDGTKYEKGNEEDMLDALAAGDVILRPMFAPEGNEPGCQTALQAFAMPVGAVNAEGFHAYVNWLMTDAERNAQYVVVLGAGFPTNLGLLDNELYETPFYKEAVAAIEASDCTPYIGSLMNPIEGRTLVMNAIYKLVKEDQTADISAELQAVQDEYNDANN
jgi:multiple sugar transport system substrate-binding protein